jgi:Glycosyltransferases involved in cell wall biogenesis
MADKINISLVIPIYNVAPYIAECIQSVKNQTWKGRLECILVDDCGTDDSMAVVEKELQGYEGKVKFSDYSS